MTDTITAYKLFNVDWTCNGFQFGVGKTYTHEGEVRACKSGFHACTDPHDCLSYYPLTGRAALVELSGKIDKHDDDSKVAAERIKIVKALSNGEFISAIVKKAIAERLEGETATGDLGVASATGDLGVASATGYLGVASATGYLGVASATGDRGAASATGYRGAASATGDRGAASATGYLGVASATGDLGAASATGYLGVASATGYLGAASATGDLGAASATGDRGAAMASGYAGKAKAADGNALFLAERDGDWNIIHVFAGISGQGGIEPDTWYTLRDGKPVEVA